ncbi:hypothetical protein CM19_06345 [Candidatus Acidianus copahuensis]|uniref:DUF2175 domain-containing protein n=1 Tax=Candidatus Acidianus copahuensis TaxID=1160895 RepID=A0A031LQF1_9CREN|nr:DUF2175 family protein [Candidatus Acidianus copahuensis]EZQ06975.1 hypothetical protein CM19_06345 [Candidatus Acidianus copahuensis]
MSRAPTKWKCDLCNNAIYWDELFTYTSKKNVVHFNCFKDKALKTTKIDEKQIRAIVDSLEDELKMITLYKQRIPLVTDEEVKKFMEQAEKDAEKNSAMLTRAVEKLSRVLE